MKIKEGSIAPDFTLPDQNRTEHNLSDFRGKPVVLYFYPADDTPGCTTEACNFRDDYSQYIDAGVEILGVSPDSSKAHSKFRKKYDLPFTLLADELHEVAEKFGVWGLKKSFGREYLGVIRTTFIIDEGGEILKVFENVRPANHSTEVLAAIAEKENSNT